MSVQVRFAPSPTGKLHVGNARLALVNWLFARAAGGRFLLRLDDTDAERSTAAFAAAIERDLAWLGLDWRGLFRQSDRADLYRSAADRLKAAGRLYPCYETPEELDFMRRRQRARGRPPIYDRAALKLSAEDVARLEAEGRRPHWRFLLEESTVAWEDMVRGPVRFEGRHLSDPVLIRADGTFLYALPSVVDDGEMGITHVVRGEDHVANTAAQCQIFAALGYPAPRFAHLPLLVDATGKALSKRLGSLSLEGLRTEEGIEPLVLASFLATLGTSGPVRLFDDLDALAGAFDFAAFGRAAPKFDAAELRHLNAQFLHDMDYETARPRLAALGLADASPEFWAAIRPNLDRFDAARDWHAVCHGEIAPVIEDAAFAAAAAGLLPDEPWDGDTWRRWTAAVKEATGRKGKALFRPLRLALTGREHGPELQNLLPIIGRARALDRLRSMSS